MTMNRYKRSLLASAFSAVACLGAFAINSDRVLLDDNWLFSRTDSLNFNNPEIKSDEWQPISLPHDWSVLYDFNKDEPSGNDGGYLPTGKGWYRKILTVEKDAVGKPCDLYFEGAYMNSKVYVNGHEAGGHPYGYSSFRCDISPYLKEGDNIIAVEIDNSRQKNSRWYSGSGIYRHVWLEHHADVYVAPWSLHITTPIVESDKAVANIAFTIVNTKYKEMNAPTILPIEISLEGMANVVKTDVKLLPGEKNKYCVYQIPVKNPRLWSPQSPSLYNATVKLLLPDNEVETESETFGFRKIEYSADGGFKINGTPMLISGACIHHDNGILGAASFDDSEVRKARLLKDAGFNAVRTSHNPPAPKFLEACDSIGLFVIDEAFDGWKSAKNSHDYHELFDEWSCRDIAAMVERDRNHPSVIAWSIGNEIIERKEAAAVERADMLASKCRELDGTRPVTQALAAWDPEWEIYDPLASNTEIVGYNYMIHKAEGDHQRMPARVMWQTESYPRDAFKNWEKVNDLPYVIGDYVWTAIDYIGESGIGRYWYEGDPEGEHYHRPLWPWHNAYCGDIDIIGQRKPISYYREILYSQTPKMHLSVKEPQGYNGKIKEGLWAVYPSKDSWNWPGHEGKQIDVEIASNYPVVELLQDGVSMGKKPTDRNSKFMAVYQLDYRPGTLEAIAYDDEGNITERQILKTAGKPYTVRISADKSIVPASSQSLIYLTSEVVDKKGNIVSDATIPLTFSCTGNGKIIATGSSDPKDPNGYFRTERTTCDGKALCVVKADGQPGEIIVTVKGKGLKSAHYVITTK